ncbi:MAG: flagellar biosynthesis anti-sigma factor FlgM [Rhodocyclaceae bacterium]|nr:flagellar biosynthesis anti-sigma factor FlgM [Rhodocyclaceae bacterium]
MKINNSVSSVGGLSSNEPKARVAKEATSASTSNSGDKVELSSLSSRLQQMESAMANSPVVDTAKVAEVKQAISDGRFQVHAEKVADSLIQSVQQMLQAQQVGA